MTSDAAVEPYEGRGGHGSSKAALEQLTNVLGAEQADLRVYAFDPGDAGGPAEPGVLKRSYLAALGRGYRWHEFGDTHLIL